MKLRHTLAVATALTILGAMVLSGPAEAQTYDPKYPVCLQVFTGSNDYYYECSYTSIPQCQMSASGRHATCLVNPYYAGPKGKRSKQRAAPY